MDFSYICWTYFTESILTPLFLKTSFSLFTLETGSEYTTQAGPKLMLFLCKHTTADITGLHHHIQPFVGFDIFVFSALFWWLSEKIDTISYKYFVCFSSFTNP